MPPPGLEPAISTGERRQTYVLDPLSVGTGREDNYWRQYLNKEETN